MAELMLPGCAPEPLMAYLKALGVLRLVAAQADPEARGARARGRFVLWSTLDAAELRTFFLETYQPTPLVAPWGARSGFFPESSEATARAALAAIRDAPLPRLRRFQEVLQAVQSLLIALGCTTKVRDDEKLRLMRACRARLPDAVVPWLDATYVLTQGGRTFPPLLGAGGNEGSGSYVSGFAQQVVAVLIRREWDAALDPALFRTAASGMVRDHTPGHFAPAASGGANVTQGFEGDCRTNPWDYLLALEGACLWACGVTRRLDAQAGDLAALPFTVRPSPVGSGTLAMADGTTPVGAKRAVAEMRLPLWGQPATLAEVQQLVAEGRASRSGDAPPAPGWMSPWPWPAWGSTAASAPSNAWSSCSGTARVFSRHQG